MSGGHCNRARVRTGRPRAACVPDHPAVSYGWSPSLEEALVAPMVADSVPIVTVGEEHRMSREILNPYVELPSS